MIQAEIGGAARVDPGFGLQRPGYLIRDFALPSSTGENIQISSFRGRANLLVVFPGYSDGMRAFLENAAEHSREFSEQEATIVAVIPYGREERDILTTSLPQFLSSTTRRIPRIGSLALWMKKGNSFPWST